MTNNPFAAKRGSLATPTPWRRVLLTAALLTPALIGQRWTWRLPTPGPVQGPFHGPLDLLGCTAETVGSAITVLAPNTQETWSWNGYRWTLLSSTITPALANAAGAVDRSVFSQQFQIYGGRDAANAVSDEHWVFLPATGWVRQGLITPGAREGHDMAGIAPFAGQTTGGLLVFGGSDPNGTLLGDTWNWNGGNGQWQLLNPTARPSARTGLAMAGLPGGDAVLFGGRDVSGERNDLWVFRAALQSWVLLPAVGTAPAPRRDHALTAIDNNTVALVGGIGNGGGGLTDHWQYDLTTNVWTQVSNSIDNFTQHDIAWLPSRQQLEAFGVLGRFVESYEAAPAVGQPGPGRIGREGLGCSSSLPALYTDDVPRIGHSYTLELHANATGVTVLTLSGSMAADYAPCTLHTGTENVQQVPVNPNGVATVAMSVPNDPSLRGVDFFQQAMTWDGTALSYSHSLRITIGTF
ncbi:MAG: hypothetical protein KDE27_19900 [Planctomycetes bacterium]|nr:hypothetical protein [Planctomycetota bacterium]